MNCPRCGTQNADQARFCSNCGQPLTAQVAATPRTPAAAKPMPDPSTAFVLELVLGLFGFLGIGWVYAGRTTLGLVMLVGWWVIVIGGLGGSFVTGGLGCCLWLPVHVGAPIVSALLVRSEIEKNPFAAGH